MIHRRAGQIKAAEQGETVDANLRAGILLLLAVSVALGMAQGRRVAAGAPTLVGHADVRGVVGDLGALLATLEKQQVVSLDRSSSCCVHIVEDLGTGQQCMKLELTETISTVLMFTSWRSWRR